MANRTRTAAALAAMLLAGQTAKAAETSLMPGVASNSGHLRSDSPSIASAILDALERSATFRNLVATIDASDSYVFLLPGLCSDGVRACFTSVRSAGSHRFMFVTIDPTEHDNELMRSLGHELRHIIEVIDAPSVRTDPDKYFLYERIGRRSVGRSRETLAAQDAGNAVLAEVERSNRQAKSK
jgi:hypothetical protein